MRGRIGAIVLTALMLGLAREAEATDRPGVVDTTAGRWYLAGEDGTLHDFWFGVPGDLPLVGDWDCGGRDTPGAYRPSNGYVYLRHSLDTGPAHLAFHFGEPGDVPLVGDWNGNGCDTVAVYRPALSRFYLPYELGTREADDWFHFGEPGDVPFAGDFDGDGRDEVGVHRPATGEVFLRRPSGTPHSFHFGIPGDRILAGDWNGDGLDAVAVHRPSDCTFHLSDGAGATLRVVELGVANGRPVVGSFGLPEGGAPPPGCPPPSCLVQGPSSPNGRLLVVPGSGQPTGVGSLRSYLVEIEEGLPVEGGCLAAFVEATLGDRRSWGVDGRVAFQRVDRGPVSFRVTLASPATTDRLCAPIRTGGIFSCWNGSRAVLNAWRWGEGAAAYGDDLVSYRRYLVNHEVGHALGHGHVGCPGSGRPAPVMMQQTKGVGSCLPNPWPHP